MLYRATPKRSKIPRSIKLLFILSCIVCGMLVGMAGFFRTPANSAAVTKNTKTVHTKTVTVKQGETLWTIATPINSLHTDEAVLDIEKLNGLVSADIYPGEKLIVPEGGK